MNEPRIATTSRASSLPPFASGSDQQATETPVLPQIQPSGSDVNFLSRSSSRRLLPVSKKSDPPPKLVPRSAIAQGSLQTSATSSLEAGSQDTLNKANNQNRALGKSVPARGSSQQDVQGLQTMMDFLVAEPRLNKSNIQSNQTDTSDPSLIPPVSADVRPSADSIGNDDGQMKKRATLTPVASTSKRKSLSLLTRSPSRALDRGKKSLAAAQVQVDSDCDIDNEHDAAYQLARNASRWADPQADSLGAPSSSNNLQKASPLSSEMPLSPQFAGKGKARSPLDGMALPHIQLKVIPVTDLIIMFGSTQTSSNYSLSGKVVLRMKGDDRIGTHRPVKPNRTSSAHYQRHEEYQSDSDVWHSASMSASDSNSSFKTATSANEEENIKIHIRNLQVIFSGFALYGDRTGRLATTRLAHSRFELLPLEGTTIPCSVSSGQDYEIEFNLSVPGWLPSSLTSRFGGTFYCLESRAEYRVIKSQRMFSGPLIPPRHGFFSGSTPSLSTFSNAYESDTGGSFNDLHLEGDESLSRSFKDFTTGNSPNSDFISPSPLSAQARGSWLSKTARQIQSKVVKPSHSPTPGQSSSTLATPTQDTKLDLKPLSHQKDKSIRIVDCGDGYSRVQSKAKTIVIGRCREVVPVPVARMAIVGPEGLPEGAHQDPPPTPRSSSADHFSRSRSSTITATRRAPSPPPVMPSSFGLSSDPAKVAASIPPLHPSQPRTPRTPRRGSSAMDAIDNTTIHPSPTQTFTPSPSNNRNSRRTSRLNNTTVPMRHFMHQPMLHPPATAQVEGAENGLPFSLTLTLPSYVTVDGPDSDILTFAVQIEVGRSTSWSNVRELGGLRLRDMELQCIQTERHR